MSSSLPVPERRISNGPSWARRSATIVAACILAAPSVAHAKPSIWARAASPRVAREAKAVARADLAISRDYSLSRMNTAFRRAIVLRKSLAVLRRAQAHTSQNTALRYRLAQIYYRLFDVDAEIENIRRAATHFEFVAASERTPSTQRAHALMSLAICYARLARHDEEIVAYQRAIALQPDPVSHAVLLANQAEGFMARGHIIAAVHGYRASLRATPSPLMIDTGVTTLWGLAVALDRSGDLDRAIENIRRARSFDPNDQRIQGDHWFYVPAYDQHWYEALGYWQIARDTKKPSFKIRAYDATIGAWQAFTDNANVNDPWLSIAGFRLRQCESERERAREQIAREQAEEHRRRPRGVKGAIPRPTPGSQSP